MVERAREALASGAPARLRTALGGEGLIDPRLGCAGEAEIRVEVVDWGDPCDPVACAYRQLAETRLRLRRTRVSVVLRKVVLNRDPLPE